MPKQQNRNIDWKEREHFLRGVARKTAEVAAHFIGHAGMSQDPSHAGDIVAEIDKMAGREVRVLLQDSRIPLAILDEEHGVLENLHPNPRIGVIVDELDGTRPARLGMDTCSVSIAAWDLRDEAVISNVRVGVIAPLNSKIGIFSFFEASPHVQAEYRQTPNSKNVEYEDARFYIDHGMVDPMLHGMYIQPFLPFWRTGVVEMASFCYGAALALSGTVDVVLHLAHREWHAFPGVRGKLRTAWGEMFAPQSYDVAAAIPLLHRAGFTVTDAYGKSLDGVRVDVSGADHTIAGVIAARTPELHETVLDKIDGQEAYLLARSHTVGGLIRGGNG